MSEKIVWACFYRYFETDVFCYDQLVRLVDNEEAAIVWQEDENEEGFRWYTHFSVESE